MEPAKIEVHWLHMVTTCHDMSETEFFHFRRKYNSYYFIRSCLHVRKNYIVAAYVSERRPAFINFYY